MPLSTILLVSIGISLTILLALIVLFMPMKTNPNYNNNNKDLDPKINKLLKVFGGDIMYLTERRTSQKAKQKTAKLIHDASNPWGTTVAEFILIKYTLGFVGIIVSIFLFMVGNMIKLPLPLIVIMCILIPIAGYNYPVSQYTNAVTRRKMALLTELPKGIDYLILALNGGGYTLPLAFGAVTKYLEPGPIRDEFELINEDLEAGLTLEQALTNFADRSPTNEIEAFTRSLINANKLSVNMIDILRARSEASRAELELEIEKRVQMLPMKVMLILSPVCIVTLGTIATAPVIDMLMNM